MSERETLLPCPFCGGAAEIDNSDPWEWVACRDCAASGPSANYNTNPGDALAAWNIRVLPPGSDTSPAAPAHTTDAMERARELLTEINRCDTDAAALSRIAAFYTSAVEQERQACALLAFSQTSDDPAPGDWNEACEHIAEMIRSRSAEPPDTKGGE